MPAFFRYPVPPAALASPDPDTIHHAAREAGIRDARARLINECRVIIFIQYSLSTVIYSGKLNKMKHLCCLLKSKM